jgi:zinc protease
MVKQYFGNWERGSYVPDIPAEPAQDAPREAHVDWPNPTLPYIVVAFRGPAYSDTDKDKIALDLLSSIAFGENSDLYQRLVIKEQKTDFLNGGAEDHKDQELFAAFARIKDEKDMDYVREQILATFKKYTEELVAQQDLDNTRSRFRYGFAQGMNSSEAIAGALASYIALRRTPETINKVFALAEAVTPEDIRAAARRYFIDNNRTVVTLKTKAGDKTARKEGGR